MWGSYALLTLVSTLLLASGCLYYDSTWGQATAEQHNNAKHYAPARLARGDGNVESARELGVRLHATPSFAAHTAAWRQQFEKMVRDANPALASSVGVRLRVDRASIWKPSADEGDLDALNAQLMAHDPGDDTGWVIGLVGSVPRYSASFDQLGNAVLGGKHIVLRAAVAPEEIEAFERALPDIGQKERAELVRERRSHKEAGVLLHEIAHTLGALHRTGTLTIMSPTYDRKMSAFDDVTLLLMRMELEARMAEPRPAIVASANNRLRVLSSTPEGWVPAEYEGEIRRLREMVSRQGQPLTVARAEGAPLRPAASAPPPAPAHSALSSNDLTTYRAALEQERAGAYGAAWRTALPLFEVYPEALEVQELRCRLAERRGSSAMIVDAHCESAERLRRGAAR